MRRLILAAPYLVMASAFGPYIAPSYGLRMEQAVVYPLALVLMLGRAPTLLASPTPAKAIVYLWVFILAQASLVTLMGGASVSSASLYAGLDDYLLPLAIVSVCAIHQKEAYTHAGSSNQLIPLWRALGLVLCLNSALEVGQLLGHAPDYLPMFWSGTALSEEGANVAANALTSGRVTGIFNQPVEHGVAYSLGLLGCTYLLATFRATALDVLLVVGICVGGFLGASKVFIFVGFPVCIAVAVSLLVQSRALLSVVKAGLISCVVAGSLMFAYAQLASEWGGQIHISNVFVYDSLAYGLSGGRFGDQGALADKFRDVWNAHAVAGGGFGFLQAVDNAFLGTYAAAGLPGIVCYSGLLVVILCQIPRVGRTAGRRIGWVYGGLTGIILLAGFGAPVLALNRSGTLVWLFLWSLAFWRPHPSALATADASPFTSTRRRGLPTLHETGSQRSARSA